MIFLIAIKEIYHNIATPRFVMGFVLCLLLVPFSIVISINEYQSKVKVYETEKKKADEENKVTVYSAYRPVIVKQPTSLSIFARGISYNVGNRVKVFFGDKPMMTEGKAESRDNPFLNRFFTFDFVSILIIIISLVAFLFTYDLCTGERESGTLKMMLSNSISRSTILSGKLLGTFFTLLPILLFSFALCLLVIQFAPSVDFTRSEWIRIGMIFIFSVVFLILFMVIGLFISSHVQNSSTSMVICLLIWVTFLFIMPSLANYSARSYIKVGSVENLNFDIAAINIEFEEKLSDYSKKMQKADWGMTNTYWTNRDGFKVIGGATKSFMEIERKKNEFSEPLRIQYADRKWQIRKNYLDKLEKQLKLARYFSFLSPAEVFKESVAGLCATNYEGHKEFLEQIRRYRETLIDYYLKNKLFSSYLYFNRQDPDSYMTADEMVRFKSNGLCNSLDEFYTKYQGDWKYLTVDIPNSNLWQWQPLDLSALPSFEYKPASIIQDVLHSLLYFSILLALAIVLYYFSFLSFIKYNVR